MSSCCRWRSRCGGSRCRRGARWRCVMDSQNRRVDALSSIKPLGRSGGGLVPQHQPTEVGRRIVQPQLYIRNHLRRTPHVLAYAANRLTCTHRGRKVSALHRPKHVVVETMPPCGIVSGGGCSLTFLSSGVGGSFPPVGQQLVQLDHSLERNGSGHIHGETRTGDR